MSLRPLSRASVNKHLQKHCRMPDHLSVTSFDTNVYNLIYDVHCQEEFRM